MLRQSNSKQESKPNASLMLFTRVWLGPLYARPPIATRLFTENKQQQQQQQLCVLLPPLYCASLCLSFPLDMLYMLVYTAYVYLHITCGRALANERAFGEGAKSFITYAARDVVALDVKIAREKRVASRCRAINILWFRCELFQGNMILSPRWRGCLYCHAARV